MSLKSKAAKLLAAMAVKKMRLPQEAAIKRQLHWREKLLKQAAKTQFGQDHRFEDIHDQASFNEALPVRDYERLRPYVERIINGEKDILWPGKPSYFAKTSGTTSGSKYIPISKESMPSHLDAARNALFAFMSERGSSDFVDGKMIFLSGSPIMDKKGGVLTGRLSGIVNHHIPSYLQRNKLPSYPTNCIDDWEEKLDRIVDETIDQDMRLISGIPPWMQMYFDRLTERSGKSVGELFPNLELLVHGGVNFRPYRANLNRSLGRAVPFVETYPASEGFFAFQDKGEGEGLLLNVDAGMYFEFLPITEDAATAKRVSLEQVQLGETYALVISSNAGLWAYNTGDTIRFVSLDPYRIVVSGRVKHFLSAFGEHVIGEEVEDVLQQAASEFDAAVREFTVAPQITPTEGLPHHEWWIDFAQAPSSIPAFAARMDELLCCRNGYYKDLIDGSVLCPLKIVRTQEAAFQSYARSIGKLGGQNKLPRLSNDRQLVDCLAKFC